MDKVFVRNFLIFFATIILCSGTLIFFLISGNQSLDRTGTLIETKRKVVSEAEQLSKLTEGMLAEQRGYLLTGEEEFLEEYEQKKVGVSDHIASLYELTENRPAQQSRIEEMRLYFMQLSTELEKRAARASFESEDGNGSGTILEDVKFIGELRDNISRLNDTILQNEYARFETRIGVLSAQRDEYFQILLINVVMGTILLILFNGFLFRAQLKRTTAEKSLKSTEERMALAIDGTQDGIFDWNIETGEVFYSKRFFMMLGYDDRGTKGTTQDFKDLLHPEDSERIWKRVEQYLNDELSEYEQDFRAKHKSGRWVWIKSRAKAIYNEKQQPVRMVGAHTDITALKKEQEKLALAKEHAEEQNRAKSEFLAHMSHEIRTPLNVITGIGEILNKQKSQLDDKQSQLVNTLGSSSNTLKELITDILDFSKIESGEVELDERAFDLDIIFEETISMMSMRAGEKGISFVFDYGAIKGEKFFGDSMRIRQILVNLVGNAIKFTNDGGVTVQCDFEDRDDQPYLRVDVSDTGIGIEPENFDLVFERFKQADSSVSRRYGGTGLGLPISKQLAKLMGGDIFLSSELGKGSTFSLLLPAKIVSDNAQDEKVVGTSKLNKEILSAQGKDTRILVVEDYEGNVVVLSYILEELGLAYDVAVNGLEAVQKWQTNHYNLVLMDVQMPEMDGFTATAEIRAQEKKEKLGRTPIIGMTAHALVGDKDKCIAAGMDAYLPKPLVESDLKREILKYLEADKRAA